MNHISIAVENSSRKDIRQRLAGQFYTPSHICAGMVKQLAGSDFYPTTAADPFCGDGRFIVAWLEHAKASSPVSLKKLKRIVLWDCDSDAVAVARGNVSRILQELNLGQCRVDAKVCDTLSSFREEMGSVDLILTNPPWELLKSDSRDLISSDSTQDYKESLKGYSENVGRSLPGSASQKKKTMGGASVNLARAGTLACAALLSERSLMGIVLPASIFADQASAPFRREFFRKVSVREMQYFPAELRTFRDVDQPFVTVIGDGSKATSQFYLETFAVNGSKRVVPSDLSGLRPVPLVISSSQVEILEALEASHTELRMLELDMRFGLWLGRELDETRIADSFGHEGVPFLKGRQVDRFSIRPHTPPLVCPKQREIPRSVNEERLAWRDVSRPNQKRRVQSTWIPKGWVTGNSLGVGYFRYRGRKHLLALLGVINSLVFELQLRGKLHTPHVSLGVLRECLIPWEIFEDVRLLDEIESLVDLVLKTASFETEAMLERRIAKAYGLNSAQFRELLKAFPKLSSLEYDLLTSEDI
jgi:Alw26I/Eco31I/Esp3I family type II restriction m6 adenine DNA methyltransferase